MCIPGLHLSLGIFNRLWTLLENCCKDLTSYWPQKSLATSFVGATVDTLAKLSNLKLELKTSTQYSEVISDLLMYATISTDDVSTSPFLKSLSDELAQADQRTKDLVNIIHVYHYIANHNTNFVIIEIPSR